MARCQIGWGVLVCSWACGEAQLGTRYLATASIGVEGGELVVPSGRGPPWVGSQAVFPMDAFTAPTFVALAPGASIPPGEGETALGPTLALEPAAVAPSLPFRLTLPLFEPLGRGINVEVVAEDSSGRQTRVERANLRLLEGQVELLTEDFGRFVPLSVPRCAVEVVGADPIQVGSVPVGMSSTVNVTLRAREPARVGGAELVPAGLFVVRGLATEVSLGTDETLSLGLSFNPNEVGAVSATLTFVVNDVLCSDESRGIEAEAIP